ncbi:MAG: ABC transporter substrate-binding protein [Anaerolineae bacterium]|nr:ABC transporter substrate-binding protein [Anaerolineae bacterium]
MFKNKVPALLASALLVATVMGTQRPVAAQDPIKIGVAVAQTSNVSAFGQEQVIGAKLAEKLINDKGGVNGRPIQVVLSDTAGDEQGAINAFNTLINSENVVAIVGPTLSQQAFAADPIANEAGVPVVAPSNTAVGIPQIGKFIFRVSAPVTSVAPNAIKAALNINPDIKKVARAFAQNDAFSKSETVVFEQTIKDLGLEEVTLQTFQTTDTDFTSQVSNILAATPDLVVISGLAVDSGTLIKQLRELGYEGLIVGGNGLNTTNILKSCQAACDGVIVAQAYSYHAESDANKAFTEAYQADQSKNASQFSAQAFTGVQVIADALAALDKASPIAGMELADVRAKLRDQILAGTYSTPLGEISFVEAKNDKGEAVGGELVQKQFYIAQVKMNADGQTGEFVFLSVVDVGGGDAMPEATPAQ